ncbi:MAG: 5-formyltetrahydrofolate cyclo-ligase, partial [bacterium]
MQRERSVDEKETIRAELLKKRNAVAPQHRRRNSKRSANALRRLDEFRTSRRIMLYVAIKGEVETEDLIRGCIA